MKKIINTLEFIHKYGVRGFTRECYHRLIDNYCEKHFDVNTGGMISKEDLGLIHAEAQHYTALHYKHIFNMLNTLPVDKSKSTILDYGCGKGRVIVAAAACKYQKIIGVELSPLIEIAKNNIDSMKHRKTNCIELKQCDAMDFSVPRDVNVIYFFNPFKGSILESVTRSIYSSYKDAPRKIYIIYFNNVHFDKIIAHQAWLTKIDQSEVHLGISCGLYET